MSRRLPNVFVVSGPSGAGKSTVLARVLAEMSHLRFSVSHTTRPPRDPEQEGVDYHFVDDEEFDDMLARGLFLEWAEVHGHRYGTSRTEYDRAEHDGMDLLLDLDVQGAEHVREKFPDAVTVFILPPSRRVLERRLRGRGQEESSLQRRLEAAAEEMSKYTEYEYAIINDDLARSVESLKAIIRAARARTSRIDVAARAVLGTFQTAPDEITKEN
ncbi:MAG TPA: guanylate kinase [Vicinamibacteria bacterium]